jgi:hypothetical protein
MRAVWALQKCGYEGCELLAVFETEELAERQKAVVGSPDLSVSPVRLFDRLPERRTLLTYYAVIGKTGGIFTDSRRYYVEFDYDSGGAYPELLQAGVGEVDRFGFVGVSVSGYARDVVLERYAELIEEARRKALEASDRQP